MTSIDLQHVLYTGGQNAPSPGENEQVINQPPENTPPINPNNPFINRRPGQTSIFNFPDQNQNFRPGQNFLDQSQNFRPGQNFKPGQNIFNPPDPVNNNHLYFNPSNGNFQPQIQPSNPFLNNIRPITNRPLITNNVNYNRPTPIDISSEDFDEGRPNPETFAKPSKTSNTRVPTSTTPRPVTNINYM